MEQNEKYYVPDLSEFHLGFEYEEYLPSFEAQFGGNVINTSKWVSRKCNDIIANTLSHNIDMGLIRVKRLDHDDIVECFGELVQEPLHYNSKLIAKFYSLINEDGQWKMYYSEKSNACNIYLGNLQAFSGEILNKSEIRFIMKRLGIKK